MHRVGSTARTEKTGVAVTLIRRSDLTRMQRIEKMIGYKVNNARLPDSVAGKHGKNRGARISISDSVRDKSKKGNNQKHRNRVEWDKSHTNRKFVM